MPRKPAPLRPLRFDGDTAYVPLTQGYEAVIDADDAHLVACFNWHVVVGATNTYAARNGPGRKRKPIRMHRVIMGSPPSLEVDHIDGDGLNNQRKNLRHATHAENVRNRRISKRNSSGFKGVSWRKDRAKWTACIGVNGVQRHLGFFDSPDEAHAAYVDASRELHGVFGRTR